MEKRGNLGYSEPGTILMNANRLKIALSTLGLLGLMTLAGCGPTYGEIAGRVTRGGVPLEQVEVVFYPEEDGPRSVAWTDKDGHFEAMTDAIQNTPARKGAPIGKYRVVLVDCHERILMEQLESPPLSPEEKKKAPASEARIPVLYNQRLDTPLVDIEIKPGKNVLEFEVK
jgi:hypothetical protein